MQKPFRDDRAKVTVAKGAGSGGYSHTRQGSEGFKGVRAT